MHNQLEAAINANVCAALAEDLGSGDRTAELVPETAVASAVIICREPMTLAGQPWVDEVFRQLDAGVDLQWLANDGDHLPADAEIFELSGPRPGSAQRRANGVEFPANLVCDGNLHGTIC